MKDLCGKWNVLLRYRTAYHASGNGIVKRYLKAIKHMAEESGNIPEAAVFWYNLSLKEDLDSILVPSDSIFKYK